MSGPKVVRIVTREEIIAICEGHLRRLEKAVARWETQTEKRGELSEQERAATQARRTRLHALLLQDQFAELQKAVPIEIEYLRRDQLEREERAVVRAAERRQHERRLRENASTLVRALRASADGVEPDVLQAITRLADGGDAGNAEQLLARGFSQLTKSRETDTLSEHQRELAQQLKGETPELTLVQWMATQQLETARDPRLQRIDRHIAELQLLQGNDSATPFLKALARAEAHDQPQQRNLLLDSLVIELANTAREFQHKRDRLGQLQDLASEVQTHGGGGHEALLDQVAHCGIATDLAVLLELTAQCEAILAAHLQSQAALARREAMLQGLAHLGYEVREGMATAWAESGKVVLRKNATPGYGVEVGGRADSGRLQVRAVALTPDRDKGRDRDIETLWCSEFQRLQSLLQESGGELLIERALGVGEVPLKEVLVTVSEHAASAVQKTAR